MKRYLQVIGLIALISITGCATTENTAYKSVAVIAQTVNSSRLAWNDYVARGLATKAEVIAVHDTYTKYQAVMKVAEQAVITYKRDNATLPALQTAINTLTATSTELITSIATFTK